MNNKQVVYTKRTKDGINHSVNLLSTILHLTIHTLLIISMQSTGNQERQKLDFEDDEARRERLGACILVLGNGDSLTIR